MSQSRHCKDKETAAAAARQQEEARCNTPEHVDVAPYEKRVFPLCDETYSKMKRNMPENHTFATRAHESFEETVGGSSSGGGVANLEDKAEEFHDSESTESAYGDEDPNDPEWIEMERVKDRSKR